MEFMEDRGIEFSPQLLQPATAVDVFVRLCLNLLNLYRTSVRCRSHRFVFSCPFAMACAKLPSTMHRCSELAAHPVSMCVRRASPSVWCRSQRQRRGRWRMSCWRPDPTRALRGPCALRRASLHPSVGPHLVAAAADVRTASRHVLLWDHRRPHPQPYVPPSPSNHRKLSLGHKPLTHAAAAHLQRS